MSYFKEYVVEKKTYLKEDLLKLLPDYHFAMIETVYDDDDGYGPNLNPKEAKGKEKLYLTKVSDIIKVSTYDGCFSRSVTVYFDNTKEPITLYSNNVTFTDENGNEEKVERILEWSYLSPCIKFEGVYIERTEDLVRWLLNQGVNEEELYKIERVTTVDNIIEYPGVSTPDIRKDKEGTCYSFSSEDLKLKGSEIEQVLNSIEDELLRLKIECILRARVFKKRG